MKYLEEENSNLSNKNVSIKSKNHKNLSDIKSMHEDLNDSNQKQSEEIKYLEKM